LTRPDEKLETPAQPQRSTFAPIELLIMVALFVVSFGVVAFGVLSYVFGH
jgi:hypothetical protein